MGVDQGVDVGFLCKLVLFFRCISGTEQMEGIRSETGT
jgi:hypothetical protein